MIFLCIVFPPLAMLIDGKWFQAFLCFILCITVFGWIIGIIWAISLHNQVVQERNHKELLEATLASKNK